MNIHLHTYRFLIKSLDRIAAALDRIASVSEARALKEFDYHPPFKGKLTKEEKEVEVLYTDEELDAVQEMREKMGKAIAEDEE